MKNRNLDHQDDWRTPEDFYDKLDDEFHFDFDPCPFQHQIEDDHSMEWDFWDWLKIDWGKRNFVNPPYSDKKETWKLKSSFVKKALEESRKWKLCVLLIPASTSTKLFHEVIQPNSTEIRFIKWRINFEWINSKWQYVNRNLQCINQWDVIWYEKEQKHIPMAVKNSWMHDSMLVIFDGRKYNT